MRVQLVSFSLETIESMVKRFFGKSCRKKTNSKEDEELLFLFLLFRPFSSMEEEEREFF